MTIDSSEERDPSIPNFDTLQLAIDHDRYPIEELIKAVDAQQSPITLVGAQKTFGATVLADLSQRTGRPLFIVTATEREAEAFVRDLQIFSSPDDLMGNRDEIDYGDSVEIELKDEVRHFPAYDVGPYHSASPDRKLTMQRLSTLHAMTQNNSPRYTVTSIRAATRKTIPIAEMCRYSVKWEFGDELSNRQLREHLSLCGYLEVDLVSDPGTFAIRGDLIDVFSPAHRMPSRMERWGDEITELQTFDPSTQRRLGAIEDVLVFPVREEILSEENIERAGQKLHDLIAKTTIRTREVHNLLQDLEAGLHFVGIDAILPAIYGNLSSVFQYVPEKAIIVLLNPDAITNELKTLQLQQGNDYTSIVGEEKVLAFPPDSYWTSITEVVSWLNALSTRLDVKRLDLLDVAKKEGPQLTNPSQAPFTFFARPNNEIHHIQSTSPVPELAVKESVGLLRLLSQEVGRICIVCRTLGQSERLAQLLESNGVDAFLLPTPIDVTESLSPPCSTIEIYQGDISESFRSSLLSIAIIPGKDIFGQRVKTKKKTELSEHLEISHFRDLSIGDYLVHIDFGIGRYLGLKRLEISGISNDFLHIEYDGNDKLYLPVYRLGRVQKYIGGSGNVHLDRLGTPTWERTKAKVKEQIQEVASDLIRLYAQREAKKGHAFSQPDEMFRRFEDAFPYHETDDQNEAIVATLDDMTSPRPMDRLICGDVGFGKTEVAIRAAMKAVQDGYQVAVLVPTTILCEQHILSFRSRLSPFAVRVEGLSRFRSAKETRDILSDTEQGKVDVLIGTHRLLSDTVVYKRLGLLIIDEEQRFGVKHKDRIKEIKVNVDVLTLTATPIPRTLQMSMLGIRDLTIIATPPHNRLAVRTHVAKFNDALIRDVINREIQRGGQVFVVHNRIDSIQEFGKHLETLVPKARIAVAHGRMAEGPLEEVMLSYVRGHANVLVSTSIIESGLDIPNANTIIVDRADMFGLGQLYQMRGRVGRGDTRAFAYFLIPATKVITKEAEQRLEVLQNHSDLGSGFQVASYDLEIRGAGNLLGDNQSGHVTTVGLDLYTELLEEAVNELRGTRSSDDDEVDPEVNMPVESFIPDSYIASTSLRLMFYKRFSLATSSEVIFDTYSEMVDRFGDPPVSAKNLRDVILLKVNLRLLKAKKLDAGPSAISIDLHRSTPLNPKKVAAYVMQEKGKVRLTDNLKLIYNLNPSETEDPLKTARRWLEHLVTQTT